MTAETLKPFITPTSAEHFPSLNTPMRCQRCSNLIAIGLSAACIVLATVLVGVSIWFTIAVSELETEVKTLSRNVENLQKHLGLDYLEVETDFDKQYANALIDDPNSTDEDEDEEEDDDDDGDVLIPDEYDEIDNYEELDAMIKKYNTYDSDEEDDDIDDDDDDDRNSSDDDNLYDDFEKFKESKKKQSTRKERSIENAANGLPIFEDSFLERVNASGSTKMADVPKKWLRYDWSDRLVQPMAANTLSNAKYLPRRHIVQENRDEQGHAPVRHRGHRRRRITVKSAKSTASASPVLFTAAAHYHLNRKVPDRHAAIRVDSYPGDMYIGAPSWSNEIGTEHYFRVENGVLTVREPGLYYIYAQVCYNNTHDQNGFVIFHGHKPYLQCLNTVPTSMPHKIHTCHTSGLIYLKANETIHLRDFHSDRNVILKDANNRSYFGLMKV